jgi:hypothetical protein
MIPIILAAFAYSAPVARPDVAVPPANDPPVRISLNSGGDYFRGDHAKVRIRTAADGYLVVLRADVNGRVRVLFPLDPGDDDFVRGGKDYELRGRGDRESFAVDDAAGNGTVLAAFSPDPFHYDHFVRGDHWDYRVLDDDRVRDDAEAGLLDLVTDMADSAHFDYDVVTYTVDGGGRRYYSGYDGGCYGCGWYGPGFRIGFGFGRPYGYCDPFLYDPFYCESVFYDPFYYDPFYYGYGFGRPYRYACFNNPFCYGYGGGYFSPGRRAGGGFVFKRPASPPPLILPRQRTPVTTAGVLTPRSRDNGSPPAWGAPRSGGSAEPRRRTPPPAARPTPPHREWSPPPRRSSPPPSRPSSPPPRPRERHNETVLGGWSSNGRMSGGGERPSVGRTWSAPSFRGSFGATHFAPQVSRPAPRPAPRRH